MMTNVLIIEDDPMVAELNRTFVESIPNMNVIESFRNVEEGKKYFRQKNADLLLLDVYIPGESGIHFFILAETARKRYPSDLDNRCR